MGGTKFSHIRRCRVSNNLHGENTEIRLMYSCELQCYKNTLSKLAQRNQIINTHVADADFEMKKNTFKQLFCILTFSEQRADLKLHLHKI